MTGNQKVVWQLLSELIQICEENGIPWFVSGRSAIRCALENSPFVKSFIDTEITIPIWRIFDFKEGVSRSGIKDRMLEGLHNNSDFPGLYFKYVNCNTTLVPVIEGNSTIYKGFFVKVNFLKYKPEDKLQTKMNDLQKMLYITSGQSIEIQPYIPKGTKRFSKKRKRYGSAFGKKLFEQMTDIYSKPSKQVITEDMERNEIIFPAERFSQTTALVFEDKVLQIPSDTEEYVKRIAGEKWFLQADNIIAEGSKATMIAPGANNLVSAPVPYAEIMPTLTEAGLTENFYQKRAKIIQIKQSHKNMSFASDHSWNLANRAGDLLSIHDRYCRLKKKILLLYSNRQIDELHDVYSDYDEAVRKYESYNMGFFFDEELFEIYIYILRIYGERQLADHAVYLAENDQELKIQLDLLKQIAHKIDCE